MEPNIVERAAQMFPKLTPAQIDRISSVGHRRDVRAGEVLFDVGEQNTRFFVVLSGAIDIVRPIGDREEPVMICHPREFTGEINMLSARRSLVRARVAERRRGHRRRPRGSAHARAARLGAERDPDARLHPAARGADGRRTTNDMVLLGSRHSGSTQRIREFLSRNGQPFTYQDVETDPGVQVLLDRFHVGVDEVPVIVCRGGHVLKNPSHRDAGRRRSASAPTSIRRRCATW